MDANYRTRPVKTEVRFPDADNGSFTAAVHGRAQAGAGGGYVTMASAFAAFYAASAMMLSSAFGRTVFPVGKYRREPNVPGAQPTYPIQFALGEPGVKQGQ
jgi:hypothetical protein